MWVWKLFTKGWKLNLVLPDRKFLWFKTFCAHIPNRFIIARITNTKPINSMIVLISATWVPSRTREYTKKQQHLNIEQETLSIIKSPEREPQSLVCVERLWRDENVFEKDWKHSHKPPACTHRLPKLSIIRGKGYRRSWKHYRRMCWTKKAKIWLDTIVPNENKITKAFNTTMMTEMSFLTLLTSIPLWIKKRRRALNQGRNESQNSSYQCWSHHRQHTMLMNAFASCSTVGI